MNQTADQRYLGHIPTPWQLHRPRDCTLRTRNNAAQRSNQKGAAGETAPRGRACLAGVLWHQHAVDGQGDSVPLPGDCQASNWQEDLLLQWPAHHANLSPGWPGVALPRSALLAMRPQRQQRRQPLPRHYEHPFNAPDRPPGTLARIFHTLCTPTPTNTNTGAGSMHFPKLRDLQHTVESPFFALSNERR